MIPPILRLPTEIQAEIIDLCTSDTITSIKIYIPHHDWSPKKKMPHIGRVCRKFHAIAVDIMSTKNTLRLPVFNHLVSPNLYTSCADGSLPCFHPESGIHIPIRIIENYQSLQIDIYLDWNPGADLLSNLEALVSSLAARSSRGTKRLRCLKLDFDFTAQDMYQSADAANEFCEIANTLVAPFRKLRCLKDVQVAFFAGTMSQGSMLATNSEPREWAVPLQARISKHSQEVVKEIKGHGP